MTKVLSPVERHFEILFGLIMALSFTCTISVAEAGRAEVRTMLWAALGCNLAWGIVDAVMYLLTTLVERGRTLTLGRAIQAATTREEAAGLIVEAMPEAFAAALQPEAIDRIRETVAAVRLPQRPPLAARDFLGAVAVMLLVFLSTLPVAVPFVLVAEPMRALRVSNGVAMGMLFAAGWSLARYAGFRPLVTGAAMVAIGAACVGLTIALGG